MTVRVGIGFDAHPLVEGRRLVLAGVTVPWRKDSPAIATAMS